jgi:hypothetical protein
MTSQEYSPKVILSVQLDSQKTEGQMAHFNFNCRQLKNSGILGEKMND